MNAQVLAFKDSHPLYSNKSIVSAIQPSTTALWDMPLSQPMEAKI